MAAYRADIEIGVKGIQQLQNITKQIQTLSTGVDAVNKRLNGASQSLNAYNTNLAKAAATLEKVNAGTIAERDAIRLYVQALGQANAARDRQNKLIQAQILLQRKAVATANAGFGVQGPALPPRSARNRVSGGAGAGNAISSAIIGGGFPLLFGQGPAAAAGGALGGLAGGLLGGGFGFALSIAGTAIGDFIAQTDKLNVTLSGLNATLNTTGATAITTAQDISNLAKNLQITKDEAVELVAAFSQFGNGDIREALARGFGAVGGAQTFEAIAKAGLGEKEALEAVFSLRKQIGTETAEQLAIQLSAVGATETQAALLRVISERNIEILVAQQKTVQYSDRLLSVWENVVAFTASAVSLATQFIAKMQEGSLIKLPFLDRIQQVLGGIIARSPEAIAEQRGTELEKQLRADMDSIRKALRQETGALGIQSRLAEQFSPSRGKQAPKSRVPDLKAEYDALVLIGRSENAIRDFLFEGKEIKAADEKLARNLAIIERERLQALTKTNYLEEKIYINKLAQEKAAQAALVNEDERRAINQKRFEEELRAQDSIRAAIKPLQDVVAQQELQAQYSQTYLRLVTEGFLPAEAERVANYELLVSQKIKELDIEVALVENAIEKAKAEQLSTKALEDRLKLLQGTRTAITGQAAIGPGQGPTDAQRAVEALAQVRGELNQLADPINVAVAGANAIGNAFSQAFQGLVTGTQTAQEALSNFFKSIGEAFVSMAAEIIAKQLVMITLQTILKALGFSGGGGGGGGTPMDLSGTQTFNVPIAQMPAGMQFAEGGFVTGPTRALIGEGGEPEYVIPQSKMNAAMSRYSRGARGEAVIPGSGSDTESTGGAAVATAPIDVRYTVERINSVDYVTADQFRAGMAQAAQQGARQGEQSTLRRLQQSSSTRRRLGM